MNRNREPNSIELKNSMLQQSLNETKQAFQLWRKSIHDYKNNVLGSVAACPKMMISKE